MTLTQSSAETRVSRGTFFHPKLFLGELKRTWYIGLLWSVVLFFAYPVVVLMEFTNSVSYYTDYPDRIKNFLSEYLYENDMIPVFYAMIGGIFLGVLVMSCQFDRRKSHFVSSLPVRREAVVLTKTAAAAVWHVFAWLPNILLVLLIGLCVPVLTPCFGYLAGGILRAAVYWLPQFVYFCGAAVLAASVCGSAGMTVGMIVLFIGYTPLLLLVTGLYISEFLPSFNDAYYLSGESFSAVSATARMLLNMNGGRKGAGLLLGAAVIGLIYLALSVFLSRYRRSENAGNPFVYDRVRSFVKYLLMFLAGTFLGLLFYEIGGFLWMLFGILCGAVLCWMLCNTLFYKTPRMMFDAKRGMLIFTAAMLVFHTLFSIDPFHVDRYIPSVPMTRQVELEIDDHTLVITDRELIALYHEAAKDSYRERIPYDGGAFAVETEDDTIRFSERNYFHNAVWRTRFLLPIAKFVRPDAAAMNDFSRALTGRRDFAQCYFAEWKKMLSSLREDVRLSVDCVLNDDMTRYGLLETDSYLETTKQEFLALLDVYESEMASFGADCFQRSNVGRLSFRLDNMYINIPVYDGYPETMAALAGLQRKWQTVREELYGEAPADYAVSEDYQERTTVTAVYVNDRETGEVYRLPASKFDAMQSEGRFACLTCRHYYQELSPLTRTDLRWRISTVSDVEEIWGDESYTHSTDLHEYLFFEDMVPADFASMLSPAEYRTADDEDIKYIPE